MINSFEHSGNNDCTDDNANIPDSGYRLFLEYASSVAMSRKANCEQPDYLDLDCSDLYGANSDRSGESTVACVPSQACHEDSPRQNPGASCTHEDGEFYVVENPDEQEETDWFFAVEPAGEEEAEFYFPGDYRDCESEIDEHAAMSQSLSDLGLQLQNLWQLLLAPQERGHSVSGNCVRAEEPAPVFKAPVEEGTVVIEEPVPVFKAPVEEGTVVIEEPAAGYTAPQIGPGLVRPETPGPIYKAPVEDDTVVIEERRQSLRRQQRLNSAAAGFQSRGWLPRAVLG